MRIGNEPYLCRTGNTWLVDARGPRVLPMRMDMPRPFEPRHHVGAIAHEGPCELAHLSPARVRSWLRHYARHGGMLPQLSWYAGLPYARVRNLASGQARTVRCDEAARVSRHVYDDTVLYSRVTWASRPLGFAAWLREQNRKPGLGRPPAAFTRGGGLDLIAAGRVARVRVPHELTVQQTHDLATTLVAAGWRTRSVRLDGHNARRWFPPTLMPTLPL